MNMPKELRQLMERYCQLGRLLPQDKLAVEDALGRAATRADMEVVLTEMARVKAQIEAFLDNSSQ